MTYPEAIQLYQQQHPGVGLSTPEEQDAFNAWSGSLGPGGFQQALAPGQKTPFEGHPDLQAAFAQAQSLNSSLPPDVFAEEWANKNPNDPRLNDPKFLASLGLEDDTGPGGNAEQVLGNHALEQARLQIEADRKRQADAAALLAQYQPGIDASRRLVSDLAPTVDAQKYFQDNPDVAAAFSAAQASDPSLTAEKFALEHWNQFGRAEGRPSPTRNSAVLTSELDASGAAAAAQTAALNTQLAALASGLSGEMAARAQNLQANVAALTNNLNTFTSAERTSLAQQVASQFQSLDAEVAAKRQSLTTQLASMSGAIGQHDAAMRSALQTELAQLNAAQEPLNAARISGAETIAASVNLGAQAEQDRVRADAAQAGYIGSSTGTDMAIARAAIGGRQQAAEAMGSAKVANAADTAAIGRYGANTEFGIASGTAGARRDVGFFGAGENRALSDYGSTGTRTIADFSSTGTRTLDNASNTGRFNIGNFATNETRAAGDYGASQTRAQGDFGAGEQRNITDTAAARGLSFFSQDLQRRLAGLSLPGQAIAAEIGVRTALDDYGNSGFNRAMDNLGRFRTNGGNAPQTSPYTPNAPVDNGLGNLGAGLVSLAGGIAKGNNYWSKPSGTTPGQPISSTGFETSEPGI